MLQKYGLSNIFENPFSPFISKLFFFRNILVMLVMNHVVVESLLQTRRPVRFPAGSGILISILGLDVYPLSVFYPVLVNGVAPAFWWPQILGRPALVYLSSVLVQSLCESTPVVQWLSYPPLDLRFAGSIPVGVDGFFQSIKILSMIPSEGK